MITEIKKIKDLEHKTGIKLPQPVFFYIERYGRKIEESMEEILPFIGKKEWFLFKTDCRFKDGGIFQKFTIELEKNAKLGKEYSECILIDLAEDILSNEELNDFLDYLKSLEKKIFFLFTTKQGKNTAYIQDYIEQYFFIKKIYASEYTCQEQIEKIQKICMEYEVELSEDAKKVFFNELERKQWQEQEQVMLKIKNSIFSEIYELLLSQDAPKVIEKEMAKNVLKKMEQVTRKTHTIGFCQRGISYE